MANDKVSSADLEGSSRRGKVRVPVWCACEALVVGVIVLVFVLLFSIPTIYYILSFEVVSIIFSCMRWYQLLSNEMHVAVINNNMAPHVNTVRNRSQAENLPIAID